MVSGKTAIKPKGKMKQTTNFLFSQVFGILQHCRKNNEDLLTSQREGVDFTLRP